MRKLTEIRQVIENASTYRNSSSYIINRQLIETIAKLYKIANDTNNIKLLKTVAGSLSARAGASFRPAYMNGRSIQTLLYASMEIFPC